MSGSLRGVSAVELAEAFIDREMTQPRRKGTSQPAPQDPPALPGQAPRTTGLWALGVVTALIVLVGLAVGFGLFGAPLFPQTPVAATLTPVPTASPTVAGNPTEFPSAGTGATPSAAPSATSGPTPIATPVPTSIPTSPPTPSPTPVVKPSATPPPVIAFIVYPKGVGASCKDGLTSFVLTIDNSGSARPIDWGIVFESSPYPGDWGTASVGESTIAARDVTKTEITPGDLCAYIKETTDFTLLVQNSSGDAIYVTYSVSP